MILFHDYIKPVIISAFSIMSIEAFDGDMFSFILQSIIGILTIVYLAIRIKKALKNEQKNNSVH